MAKLKYDGLLKLNEECAELCQITSKAIAYWGSNEYPDGTDIRKRMIEEIGDVMATIQYAIEANDLPKEAIQKRIEAKLAKFKLWENEKPLHLCKDEKELYGRINPDCDGEIVSGIGGGIVCKKCGAWYCA